MGYEEIQTSEPKSQEGTQVVSGCYATFADVVRPLAGHIEAGGWMMGAG